MGLWTRLMLISFLHPTEPFREHHHGAGGLAAMQAFRACFEVRRRPHAQTSLSGFRSLAPHSAGLVQAIPPRRKNPGPCHKPDFTASERSQQVFVTTNVVATGARDVDEKSANRLVDRSEGATGQGAEFVPVTASFSGPTTPRPRNAVVVNGTTC